MINLEALFFSNNKLTSISNDLYKLHQLTHLDISYNKISLLPSCLINLHKLEYLNCLKNKIKSIPYNLYLRQQNKNIEFYYDENCEHI
jgi:hypothetical protein